jgi:hypothetical protein
VHRNGVGGWAESIKESYMVILNGHHTEILSPTTPHELVNELGDGRYPLCMSVFHPL